ncbi:proline dehydrogenase family protein [soil metagenome]
MESKVSFDNTGKAFLMKDDHQLKHSLRLFKLIHNPFVVRVGSKLAVFALKLGLPVKGLIRNTIFNQFCAGEDLIESHKVVTDLSKYKVGSILDYSAEGSGRIEDFERTANEISKIIEIASKDDSIPYTCLKMTGIISHSLLEKKNSNESFTEQEEKEFESAKGRLAFICEAAEFRNVPIYIDAEESWIQDAIDSLTEEMMWKHNRKFAIVNTTLQMYRHDRIEYLKDLIATGRKNNCFIGVKLVRGAYLEKENKRAIDMGYATPILPDKYSTDRDFNLAIDLCLKNIDVVTLCAGTHNEESTMYLLNKMKEMGLENNDKRIYCSQLYGMSDHISFNLADAGYNVTKYLPYGPINTVLPYLIRRAEENSAIAGQMGRELRLLQEEKKRRVETLLLASPGK